MSAPTPSLMLAWRLDRRPVVVFGGGTVAAGRVRLALEAGAQVTVVAPELHAELRLRVEAGEIGWIAEPGRPSHLDGAAMALTALDDSEASIALAQAARARGIPVNAADRPELCDFWFPAVHREGAVHIAVSTAGLGPSLARRVKEHIARHLPAELSAATARFGALRRAIRAVDPAPVGHEPRMRFVGRIGRTWPWARLAALDDARIAALVAAYLAGPETEGVRGGLSQPRIRLVGAGPGDPTLLTEAAARALDEADLVIADRLLPAELTALVGGELRVARKWPGRAIEAQRELESWTIAAARAGRSVVRLKAGDPFLYGRGAEEVARFEAAGLAVEVIPGISSAFAAPLAVGIPVTHRGVADRVEVLTGRDKDGPIAALPAWCPHKTLVWLMAVGELPRLVPALIAAGWPPSLPVALIARASRPDQQAVRCELAALPALVAAHGLRPPAVVVMGEVVRLGRGSALAYDALPAVAERASA